MSATQELGAVERRGRTPPAGAIDGDAAFSASLLEGFALPCAIFGGETGILEARNTRFTELFERETVVEHRAAWMARFESFTPREADAPEPFADDADARETTHQVYEAASGRSFALTWRPLGESGAVMVSVLNLTEMHELLRRHSCLHEQLLSSSRVLSVGEIVNTLAHELNQPLGAASNYLEVAGRFAASGNQEKLEASVSRARSQVDYAAGVISRIREFVRTREPQREARELVPCCQRVLELLQPEAQKNRVRVRLDIPGDLPPLQMDAVMIEQVLANLGKNAIEAMLKTPPAERVLRIEAVTERRNRVRVSVIDNGPGLTAEEAQRLFTPMYTTKSRGMGIGLAISRSIVEFHEGRLFVEPGERRGASFAFTLPVAESSDEQ